MARQKLIHIHSFVNGKAPSSSTVSFGEIAVNCNSNSPKLYIKTAAASTETTAKIESFSPDSVIDKKFVIVKGDADNSAVLKGETEVSGKPYKNRAISQTSVAIGAATTAGLKGWYYSAIDFTNKTITLSDRPTYILAGSILLNGGWSSGIPNIEEGDTISLVNDSKYDLCSKVTAVNGNVITVDSLPFTGLVQDSGAAAAVLAGQFSDGYSFYIPERPGAGIIDFGGGAFSEGGQSMATNICAHAEGLQTHAYGQYSHAEGRETKAGYAAHAEGRATEAIGTMSHAEGQSTLAIGSKSHAEGTQTETHANNSHSEGYKAIVKDGAGAHAEGYGSVIDFTESTKSSDIPSDANKEQSIGAHVEGVNNTAAGIAVHVEGKNNKANRTASHAEGVNTRAGVFEASTENATSAEGLFTHAEGNSTLARGSASHAEGAATKSLGRASHAEGRHSVAGGNYSHAEGFDTFAGDNGGNLLSSITNTTKGYFTHAEGHNTLAEGNSSHAEGKGSKALGDCSHAEGYDTLAGGNYSHAEGYCTLAEQADSHAEGNYSHAEGGGSHAEGCETHAKGPESHAEGFHTLAEGTCSHAEGHVSHAAGYGSHAEGYYTIAYNKAEHASGIYNKSTQSSDELQATRFSIGIGTSDTDRKNAFEVKQNGDIYIEGVGGYDGTNPDTSYDLATYLPNMVNITYDELVALRNNSKLVPGQQYRITDYVTTTIQENTQSAGHQFDIIVTADNENTLNEVARACMHDGDNYFSEAGANLAAWQIWYSLDNDAERFAWADTANGKGVIYRMIDEWNNDCPYDFKNIIYVEKMGFKYTQWGGEHRFIRNSALDKVIDDIQYYGYSSETIPSAWSEGKCWVTDAIVTSGSQLYNADGSAISYGGSMSNIVAEDVEYYTFRDDGKDASLSKETYSNIVNKRVINGQYLLNKNIFGVGCYSNKLGNNSFNNTFGNNCYENNLLGGFIEERGSIRYCANNSFGNGCKQNVFGYVAFGNTFGDNCCSNTFGNNCHNNHFGNDCCYNSFGNDCRYNSLDYSCQYNSLGNDCQLNNFGELCSNNNLENSCDSNILLSRCYYNSFGNYCYSNSFGNDCYSNTFGNDCEYNSFGNYCKYNSFGNDCEYNSFRASGDDTSSLKSYCYYNHFDDGCSYNVIWNAATTSSSYKLQNINVNRGVVGTSSSYNMIKIDVLNQDYEIQVAKNSKGEIKIYCEADLIA